MTVTNDHQIICRIIPHLCSSGAAAVSSKIILVELLILSIIVVVTLRMGQFSTLNDFI